MNKDPLREACKKPGVLRAFNGYVNSYALNRADMRTELLQALESALVESNIGLEDRRAIYFQLDRIEQGSRDNNEIVNALHPWYFGDDSLMELCRQNPEVAAAIADYRETEKLIGSEPARYSFRRVSEQDGIKAVIAFAGSVSVDSVESNDMGRVIYARAMEKFEEIVKGRKDAAVLVEDLGPYAALAPELTSEPKPA